MTSCQSDEWSGRTRPPPHTVKYNGQLWHSYEAGVASWYGEGFYYRQTANGESFVPGEYYTAAHKYLPFGTWVIVRNKSTNKAVLVRINDRGPFVKGRVIDLSHMAAEKLGIKKDGTASVVIYVKKLILLLNLKVSSLEFLYRIVFLKLNQCWIPEKNKKNKFRSLLYLFPHVNLSFLRKLI